MIHTRVKSYKYRVGKNHYLVLQIFQSAVAHTRQGNALASNAVNVKIAKKTTRR
ncbi:hypothetical protein [Gordoniibacillus kamchatkensis]|uniref:hypothetical protein n=1 Tax=Gordoniibacillus kamchatkensis TaxID=1590651 RepID=UPI000B054C41|nr:hypothetical protein [Paenibacillus sp. VKM B-2647]